MLHVQHNYNRNMLFRCDYLLSAFSPLLLMIWTFHHSDKLHCSISVLRVTSLLLSTL